jgi:hypothetical protein
MTPENNITNKTRVSIAERLVPALSYAVAAASGAIGAVMILQLLNSMRSPEMAGAASFFMATARLEAVVGTVLLVAATIGGIGILVAVIRLFTTNTKASPPGVLFLLLGLLALIPPFVVHYVTHSMEHFVMSIEPGREAIVGETASTIAFVVIGASIVLCLVLIAFSFLPFSARPGRKYSSAGFLLLIEIAVVAMCALFFWQATQAMSHANKLG